VNGPFDRRFKCAGFPKIIIELEKAIETISNVISGKKLVCKRDKENNWYKGEQKITTEKDIGHELLLAQKTILYAASLIGERVDMGSLDCVLANQSSCYYGGELEEYLKK
jgi:hypothetical protein